MKRPTRYWLSLLCYTVCIKCATIFVATSSVDPVGNVDGDWKGNWKLFRRESNLEVEEEPDLIESVQNRASGINLEKSDEFSDGRSILFSTDKCSRYCIKRDVNKNDDNYRYINLFWTANDIDVTDQNLSKDHLQLLPKLHWTEAEGSNIRKNCQIYLDLDCNVVEGGPASNYTSREFQLGVENSKADENYFNRFAKRRIKVPVKIAEQYNLSEQTQTKFLVDSTVPRIVINIDGNVSNALLRIPTNATVSKHGTTISWSRKNNMNGVSIDTQNAPPGEWWLKLVGEDNSKYHFAVEGFAEERNSGGNLFLPDQWVNGNFSGIKTGLYPSTVKTTDSISLNDKKTFNENEKIINSQSNLPEEQNSVSPISPKIMENGKIIQERSLKHRWWDEWQSDPSTEAISKDSESSVISSSTENEPIKLVEYVTFMTSDTVSASPNIFNENSSERVTSVEEELRSRSSIGMMENLDINVRTPPGNGVNISLRMIEALDNREVSEELMSYSNENTIEEKRMLIELNRNSKLLVTPGTIHRIVFDVKNNCILPVRYAFRVKSTPFRVYNIQPVYAWIYPGQMSNVAVDLLVPDNATPDAVNTVTLIILGTEIKEKSVYLYVKGSLSKLTDDVKPTIEYSFNNNCAGKLEKDQCYKSRWSVDITIQDYDSGLKRVISSPNEIFPRTEFISGTRSPTIFYYSSTCCDKTAKITAIDLLDNYNTYTIDVTAWNNLSQAEIAAITVGAFLALLLVILIIILIVYCIRRRKSHDLPYTQRYGSRPPGHSERTNL